MDLHRYILLIYQVPSQPSGIRVGIWRELKKMGALYLQQSVCIFPDLDALHPMLQKITERITEQGGNYHLLPLSELPQEEESKIVDSFIVQSNLQYDEIIENCDVNFSKEIEFETFRQNFTYAEAEEIGQELDKIRRWYDRTVERDWFGAARREVAQQRIEHCAKLLEEFEEKVFLKEDNESRTLLATEEPPPLYPRRTERSN